MTTRARATIEDLYRLPGNQKAEIVAGEMILMSPTGSRPGRGAMKIVTSLSQHEASNGGGYAFGDNVGFAVNLPHRSSFSPDAAWYVGNIDGMDFLQGSPAFAVEIRSKSDYGPQAEQAIAQKIKDYFAAGTRVVWDVDLLNADVIRVHRAETPATTVYRRGEMAEAEPAVVGWRFPVDQLFE